ncbi:MAG: IclR family transcriptional regulator [Candidatus Puniceispirillum sp.]
MNSLTSPDTETTGKVAPNLRTLRIMEVLAEVGKPMTPTEITDHLGWPKQTTHRLCQTMVAEGYLEKIGRRLQTGTRLLKLTSGLVGLSANQVTRHQVLLKIAREVGETVNFVMPESDGMRYIDRVETNWPFRILLPIGTHVPFHCTASGKVYLSNLKPKIRQALIAGLKMEIFTQQTHASVESLNAELKQISHNGYAIDREEFHDDMVAIAVPVRDPKGRFYAALAVHGPKQRFSEQDARDKYKLLSESAKIISDALFA